ncbi:MAG: hypothetical protein JXR56_03325, partial [Candidatus Cloacimonetes bacterium]|nr:hypothetical protein [Candidatus Cloacimonadota bacterium]
MRKQKFLFWLVIIILIFNAGILVLTKTRLMNGFLNKYAISYLSEKLDSKITISDLSLSDKQVIVNNIQISSNKGDYMLNMNQLIVDYRLIGLLPIFNKNYRPLNDVTAVNPEFIFKYRIPEEREKKAEKFEIPNLGKYLGHLSIIDGNVKYTIEKYNKKMQELYLTDEITGIEADLMVQKNNEFKVDFNAKRKEGGIITANCLVKDGFVRDAFAEVNHMIPAEFTTIYLDELDFVVDLKGEYHYDSKIDSTSYAVTALVEDAYLSKQGHKMYIPEASLVLADNQLDVVIAALSADEVVAKTGFTILELFSDNPNVMGSVNLH